MIEVDISRKKRSGSQTFFDCYGSGSSESRDPVQILILNIKMVNSNEMWTFAELHCSIKDSFGALRTFH
jgi:hypothetical protein